MVCLSVALNPPPPLTLNTPRCGIHHRRIVLSHLHVATWRRTRSTQRLVSLAWLAEELSCWNENTVKTLTASNGGLEACCWWRSLWKKGGWLGFRCNHGRATNFPTAAACVLWASVRRKRVGGASEGFWSEAYFLEHHRADSLVAFTCCYMAEDTEYSEARFHWLASGGIIKPE